MYLTTAICLEKDDMMYVWLTYILMHFSEFKLMLMPNLKNIRQLSTLVLSGTWVFPSKKEKKKNCNNSRIVQIVNNVLSFVRLEEDYLLPHGLWCLTLLQLRTPLSALGFS